MAYTKYSLTPANNNAAPPDGAPEGMLPSAVNDTMRDMMSQIRDCGDGIRGGTYTMTAPVITGGSVSGITDLAIADGGTGASTATNARTNLGVTATGADTTYAYRANNLSDLASASTARSNLGLGTIATQAASSVAVTGGTIDGTVIGGTTRAAGSFTTVTTTNDASISGLTVGKGAGSNNTLLGFQAGLSATGNYFTAIGYQAGVNNTDSVYGNTFVGGAAGKTNTSGGGGTAIGNVSLTLNTTGPFNSAIGSFSLQANTTGGYNTAVGSQSLNSNTTASNNTAVGYQAGYSNTTNGQSTFIGQGAGYANTGAQNIFIGAGSGANATTGANNIVFESPAGYSVFNLTTESSRILMGTNLVTNAYVKVAWTVTSDARDKTNIVDLNKGLDFVTKLQPKQYQFKISRENETPSGNARYGFLAQDILALEGNNPVIIDNEDVENLKYNGESLVPVLVKAIQELKAEIDSLKQQLGK